MIKILKLRAKPDYIARINLIIYLVVNVHISYYFHVGRVEYTIMNPIYEINFKDLDKLNTIKFLDVLVFEYSGSIYCIWVHLYNKVF